MNSLWYVSKLKWPAYTLLPLTVLYRVIISLRRLLFKFNIKKTYHFSVPVIVVGNITVGGTGKTPLVAELVRQLKEKGYQPGIVSRGYGGKPKSSPQSVTRESSAKEVGDEALMLHLQTQCPVVVDSNRVSAVNQLLAEFNCDIVISDDGLQHYAMGRDIEIAVIDGERRLGNGYCLPLGPMREPKSRLENVDMIICNGDGKENEISMQIESGEITSVLNFDAIVDVHSLMNKKVYAVAGIGNPDRFFNGLRKKGLTIETHAFCDHHQYKPSDFNFLKDNDVIIMTEKDAVKCKSFADKRFYYLPIKAKLPELAGWITLAGARKVPTIKHVA